eukprot:comp22428_c0_seq2/m.54923 comp22428_c0_seq2/g.54923  ORF comp22428_c0_seq2/g.54923 comp22428_c0_seq2/m.54923 type:complete len:647 (+) comp22428_c0_seq2:621-2561(+)
MVLCNTLRHLGVHMHGLAAPLRKRRCCHRRNLQMLSIRVANVVPWRLALLEQLRVRELALNAGRKVAHTLELRAAVDELLVAVLGRKAVAKVAHAEVLCIEAVRVLDLEEQLGLAREHLAKLEIVVDLRLVAVRQRARKLDCALPVLAVRKELNRLQIQLLLLWERQAGLVCRIHLFQHAESSLNKVAELGMHAHQIVQIGVVQIHTMCLREILHQLERGRSALVLKVRLVRIALQRLHEIKQLVDLLEEGEPLLLERLDPACAELGLHLLCELNLECRVCLLELGIAVQRIDQRALKTLEVARGIELALDHVKEEIRSHCADLRRRVGEQHRRGPNKILRQCCARLAHALPQREEQLEGCNAQIRRRGRRRRRGSVGVENRAALAVLGLQQRIVDELEECLEQGGPEREQRRWDLVLVVMMVLVSVCGGFLVRMCARVLCDKVVDRELLWQDRCALLEQLECRVEQKVVHDLPCVGVHTVREQQICRARAEEREPVLDVLGVGIVDSLGGLDIGRNRGLGHNVRDCKERGQARGLAIFLGCGVREDVLKHLGKVREHRDELGGHLDRGSFADRGALVDLDHLRDHGERMGRLFGAAEEMVAQLADDAWVEDLARGRVRVDVALEDGADEPELFCCELALFRVNVD